jgi:superfamily II DNA or RNA helicase
MKQQAAAGTDADDPSQSPLVRLLALAGPLGRTRLRDLLQAVGLVPPGQVTVQADALAIMVDEGLAKGWLIQVELLGVGVAPAHARSAILSAVRSGDLVRWRDMLLELHGIGVSRIGGSGLVMPISRPGDDMRIARLLWLAPSARGERRWFAQRVEHREGLSWALLDAFCRPVFDAEMLELLAPPWRAMVVDEWLARSLSVPRPSDQEAIEWAVAACAYETANPKVPVAPAEWIVANAALFMSGFVDGRGFADNGDMSDESADAAQLRLRWRTADYLSWQGRVEPALRLLDGHDDPTTRGLRGQFAVLAGQWDQAEAEFDSARRDLRDVLGRRTMLLPFPQQWIHAIGLLLKNTPIANEAARKLCRAEAKASGAPGWFWSSLEAVAEVRLGDRAAETIVIEPSREDGFVALNDALRAAWLRRKVVRPAVFDAWATRFAAAGYQRIADEFAVARAISEGHDPPKTGPTLAGAFASETPWRRALAAIAGLAADEATSGSATVSETRLIWMLEISQDPNDYDDSDHSDDQGNSDFAGNSEFAYDPEGRSLHGRVAVAPFEQKRGQRGWGKPKALPLTRLARSDSLTDADAQVARLLKKLPANRWALDPQAALVALIGHPHVFYVSSPETPLELVSGHPELLVERSADGARLRLGVSAELREAFRPVLVPNPYTGELRNIARPPTAVLIPETPTRARVVRIASAHRRIVELVGEGLDLPAAEGGELLARALHAAAAHFEVQDDGATTHERDSDGTLIAELAPTGNGVRLRLAVRPLGEEGPRSLPGRGGARLLADVHGERRAARRDLKTERALLARLLDAVPLLSGESPTLEWRLDDPQDALALMEGLQSFQSAGEALRIEWPPGAKLRVSRAHGTGDLRLRFGSAGDWLQIDGGLALDDGRVIAMRVLLEAAKNQGRYLPLGEGEYLAITSELRERIDAIAALAGPGDVVRVDPIAALALDELVPEAQIERDAAWQQRLERMRSTLDLVPAVPSTLCAELRPYQIDGFVWMARLAHWGAGACLADDMGLGKTVQTLALLLHRAAGGPALVIAPTSVCANWAIEAARFAPTLRVTRLHEEDDRADAIAQAGPNDLIIASYGLLAMHDDELAAREWSTLVLDEAQAIKNSDTRRAQAALRINAAMRVAVTGTPVENRLDELWTLMHLLNPGLLGPRDRFAARFAVPIERDRDPRAAQRLRRLVRPFLLRRTKSEVLSDLPERTEIALRIEPSPDEVAFHTALRAEALEAVSEMAGRGGDARFHVLAQISRLRRAASDPRLAVAGAVGGAKLDALIELIDELIVNRHKALVFSQFTGFLDLAEERLKALGVRFHRLDGSTPAAARATRVAAFQAGEGEVFLISLKAGGSGLNLTAADYVILCDPWWNPAVEAQAAGRAHRIGQNRPVTVYRLLTAGTIEERIIAMHETKRAIADALLERTGEGEGDGDGGEGGRDGVIAGALDVDELIELMR